MAVTVAIGLAVALFAVGGYRMARTARLATDRPSTTASTDAPPARPHTAGPIQGKDARSAALLVTGGDGRMRIQCLHGGGTRGLSTDATASVEDLFDAAWVREGLYVAANVAGRAGAPSRLAVLTPDTWRLLDSGVKGARLSLEAGALLFEVVIPTHVAGGTVALGSTTKMMDLHNGAVTTIGRLSDPRWEAGGKSVLATRVDRQLEERKNALRVRWRVSRVRWDRRSGITTALGQGDAQIPSPRADAIAWRDAAERPTMPSYPAGDRCAVTLGAAGGTHTFAVEGRICLGSADDRSIRFSPDGKWLAFSSFDGPVPDGPVPVNDGKSDPPMFLRIVSASGVEHPAAERVRVNDIQARSRTKNVDPASMRAGYRWLDWSPTSTALVAEDADGTIAIFDLTAGTRTAAGPGRAPTFDESGEHVLGMGRSESGEVTAFVIHREARDVRDGLGHVRDAQWLGPSACEAEWGGKHNGQ